MKSAQDLSLPTHLNAARWQIVTEATFSSPWWGQSVSGVQHARCYRRLSFYDFGLSAWRSALDGFGRGHRAFEPPEKQLDGSAQLLGRAKLPSSDFTLGLREASQAGFWQTGPASVFLEFRYLAKFPHRAHNGIEPGEENHGETIEASNSRHGSSSRGDWVRPTSSPAKTSAASRQ